MPDFDPVAQAKHIISVYRQFGYTGDPNADMGTLVDLIDAQRAALSDSYMIIRQISIFAEDVDTLAHTIRHLLED